jgi:hypothetical protein
MTADRGPREGSRQPSGEVPRVARRRPRWVNVLAVLMLLVGARLFLGSLSDLRRLATGQSMVEISLEGLTDVNREVLLRGQLALEEAVDRAHPTAAKVQAVARFGLALLLLFAVAAVYSDDARARRVSTAAGWATVALNLGSGAFVLLVVRKGAMDGLPVLQQVAFKVYARAGDAPPAAADLARIAYTLMVQVPLSTMALGVVFGIVLVVMFGGRRGRLFYNRGEQAHHG